MTLGSTVGLRSRNWSRTQSGPQAFTYTYRFVILRHLVETEICEIAHLAVGRRIAATQSVVNFKRFTRSMLDLRCMMKSGAQHFRNRHAGNQRHRTSGEAPPRLDWALGRE